MGIAELTMQLQRSAKTTLQIRGRNIRVCEAIGAAESVFLVPLPPRL